MLLNLGKNRTTYRVEFTASPLFEAALGIAAATYDQIQPTLEHPVDYWQQLLAKLPSDVQTEVACAKAHNTWKTLLQLLYLQPDADLDAFLAFVQQLAAEDLRYHALPFLGTELQGSRRQAAAGSHRDVQALQQACADHLFFPSYIAYITSVDPEELRRHLISLLKGWYDAHVLPKESEITRMLEQDLAQKKAMREKLSAEELVSFATESTYLPEPTVTRVLLIPQAIYRPWTVQADAEETKIFYYPIADQHLYPQSDPYRPPHSIVQTLKALGDEQRLRIAKMLAEREMSLQELSEQLNSAKSTVHHHLSLLRAAHLVETTGTKYRWRQAAWDRLPLLLEQFMEQAGSGEGRS